MTIAVSKYFNDPYHTILNEWSIDMAADALNVIEYLQALEQEQYDKAKSK